MQNIIRLITTILAPVGAAQVKETIIPIKKQRIETIADDITTERKQENTLIEARAGNIIRLDISIAPIRRIPITITRAVKRAINML